jgi:hypothetical protein
MIRSSFSARPIDAAAVVVSGGVSNDDSEIQRRREEEHRLRMEMGRTVNLDEHREALSMLDSNNLS